MTATATAPNGTAATISRAVVAIETVRVGPKQMTKAVYNQLPEVPFAKLTDVLGWVNVCPLDCPFPPPSDLTDFVGVTWTDADGNMESRRDGADERVVPIHPNHRHYLGTVTEDERVILCRAVARWHWFRGKIGSIDYVALDGCAMFHGRFPQLFIAV